MERLGTWGQVPHEPGHEQTCAVIDALMSKLEVMIPELMAANGALPEGVPEIPYELRSTGRVAPHA